MASALGQLIPNLAYLDRIVQTDYLVREFLDALYPANLYRRDATVERWAAHLGDTQVMSRASLLAPATTPLTPGVDPTPKQPKFEQWSVIARQYGDSMNTHMPTDWATLASLFTRNTKTLGLQSATSINRVARNSLFKAYLSGETMTTSAATSTSLVVQSINGFTQAMQDGRLAAVSSANPLAITIAGVSGTVNVTAAVATDPARPLGPGTLTLASSKTWLANAKVRAATAPLIVRANGATSIDGLTSTSGLTFAAIRKAVAEMRRNQVPPHEDGMYHVHLDPLGEAQLLGDNEFQRAYQGLGDSDTAFREFAIGKAAGCLFITNSQSPSVWNTGTAVADAGSRSTASFSDELLADVRNLSGVAVSRTIITGKGAMMEAWIDENSEYASAAGYTGKVGSFNVVNNGLVVEVDRIRYIIRAPIDVLQQVVTQAWSFSGDWGIPSDLFGGVTGALFKRACVIESGSED